ncbi:MAG TPA: ankyrin repeat domain-containing protein, partial [Gammaproteobacteria bacterium]|nr:ankyrin repeat domain-containing protein [Gammaproteobacteria bacterium]
MHPRLEAKEINELKSSLKKLFKQRQWEDIANLAEQQVKSKGSLDPIFNWYLLRAAEKSQWEIAQRLIVQKATAMSAFNNGDNALHYAISQKQYKVLALLLENGGAKAVYRNSKTHIASALTLALNRNDKIAIKELLKYSIKSNNQNVAVASEKKQNSSTSQSTPTFTTVKTIASFKEPKPKRKIAAPFRSQQKPKETELKNDPLVNAISPLIAAKNWGEILKVSLEQKDTPLHDIFAKALLKAAEAKKIPLNLFCTILPKIPKGSSGKIILELCRNKSWKEIRAIAFGVEPNLPEDFRLAIPYAAKDKQWELVKTLVANLQDSTSLKKKHVLLNNALSEKNYQLVHILLEAGVPLFNDKHSYIKLEDRITRVNFLTDSSTLEAHMIDAIAYLLRREHGLFLHEIFKHHSFNTKLLTQDFFDVLFKNFISATKTNLPWKWKVIEDLIGKIDTYLNIPEDWIYLAIKEKADLNLIQLLVEQRLQQAFSKPSSVASLITTLQHIA